MKKEKEKRVSKALILLYKNVLDAKENISKYESIYESLTIMQYLKEYGTIKLTSCRQAGHTSSIIDLIKEHPNEEFAILNFGHKQWHQKLKKALEENTITRKYKTIDYNWQFVKVKYDIGPVRKYINPDCLKNMDNKTIIIDMASCLKHQDIIDVCRCLNKSNILICLQ
jgi:hypothetical protein